MEEILRLEEINYQYDKERLVLKNLSVTLYDNQKVAVLGNNGAGKSTFFLCCNGIHRPQSGKLFMNKSEVRFSKKEKQALCQTVGLVFQDPDSQIIAGTVEAEVSFGPMNLKLPLEKVRSRVEDAIGRMRLEEMRYRAPHYLSGGEKKRVSIADVLSMNPKLLLLDEPTSSLDPENTRLLENNLERLSEKGLGVVISTHDIDFAWRWAQRILLFHKGELVADGEPEEVFMNKELLERCGLVQPTLLQVGSLFNICPLPRTMDDLEERMRRE